MMIAKRISAGLVALILCIGLIGLTEVILVLFTSSAYYVWPPNQRSKFRPNPLNVPGVHGDKQFSINSMGIRGEEFSRTEQYRILAVGGSTTECLILDDGETWPRIVQDVVNARQDRIPIWVGNVGKSGLSTRHHIYQVEKLLAQYPKIDAIVLLVGVNDLTLRLARDTEYIPYEKVPPATLTRVFYEAFSFVPSWEGPEPLYKRSEIWRRLKMIRAQIDSARNSYIQDERGNSLDISRAHRASARELVEILPDLTSALNEYHQNLTKIVRIASEKHVRIILMTQPVLWHHKLERELTNLLWLGGIGNFRFV